MSAVGLRWTSVGEGPRRQWLRYPGLALGALMVVGLAVRWKSFGGSLFSDELSSYYIATGHSLGGVMRTLNGHSVDLNPPLYFVLAWACEQVGGDSAQMLRLVSLLAGLVAIPLTYVLVVDAAGRLPAAVAAALVALSPYLIFYSTEARPYALLMALVLASVLVLRECLQRDRAGWWAAYALLLAAALYTHFTSVFPLAAGFTWGFLSRPAARKKLVACGVAAAALFTPWVPALIADQRSPGRLAIGILQPFSLPTVWADLSHCLGNPYVALRVAPGVTALRLSGLAVLLALGSLAVHRSMGEAAPLRIRRPARLPRGPASRGGPHTPIMLLLLATPVGLALYSMVSASVWDTRNLIVAWPALAATAAVFVTRPRPPFRQLAAALLLAAAALGALAAQRVAAQRPDYDAAARVMAHEAAPRVPIVEVTFFTPGPPSEAEAALALGPSAARAHPVLRLGLPPLAAVLAAPPYAMLALQPGDQVAAQALSLAGGRDFFLVAPGDASPALLLAQARLPQPNLISRPEYEFLHALLGRARVLQQRTFPGLAAISVYRVAPVHGDRPPPRAPRRSAGPRG